MAAIVVATSGGSLVRTSIARRGGCVRDRTFERRALRTKLVRIHAQ